MASVHVRRYASITTTGKATKPVQKTGLTVSTEVYMQEFNFADAQLSLSATFMSLT